jgi:hypothetical protein
LRVHIGFAVMMPMVAPVGSWIMAIRPTPAPRGPLVEQRTHAVRTFRFCGLLPPPARAPRYARISSA